MWNMLLVEADPQMQKLYWCLWICLFPKQPLEQSRLIYLWSLCVPCYVTHQPFLGAFSVFYRGAPTPTQCTTGFRWRAAEELLSWHSIWSIAQSWLWILKTLSKWLFSNNYSMIPCWLEGKEHGSPPGCVTHCDGWLINKPPPRLWLQQ